mmetsp:Transcript_11511/g.12640  ORF Transcript_11511/g.12640 Transcript_11511/m.12640 type:complete len:438 (+) Transcript_11511:31-1344(+)
MDKICRLPRPPTQLFAKNRTRLFAALEKRVTGPFLVHVEGGKQKLRNADVDLVFRQESDFLWLTGCDYPDCSIVLDSVGKKAILFVPKPDERYAVWHGTPETLEQIKSKFGIDVQYDEDKMKMFGMQNKMRLVLELSAKEPAGVMGPTSVLRTVINELRSIKTEEEIALMKAISKVSSDAHAHVMKIVTPGSYEFQLESEFYNYCGIRGMRHQAYLPIVGTGKNGAVLHYMTNTDEIKDGDLVLIDAGGELSGYASDITRTFPANGKFTPLQKEVYEIVLNCQKKCIERIKPGLDFNLELKVLAEEFLLEGLLKAEFIQGPMVMLKRNKIARVFMPHGLGHLLGLDVHDTSMYPKVPLAEGMIVTIEPGIYFNGYLIDEAFKNEEVVKFLNTKKIEKCRNFGGIRIEDDILVTKDGYENLTVIAKETSEIEAIMAST